MDPITMAQEIVERGEVIVEMVKEDMDEPMTITWDGAVHLINGFVWFELIGDYKFFSANTSQGELITILELEEAYDFTV